MGSHQTQTFGSFIAFAFFVAAQMTDSSAIFLSTSMAPRTVTKYEMAWIDLRRWLRRPPERDESRLILARRKLRQDWEMDSFYNSHVAPHTCDLVRGALGVSAPARPARSWAVRTAYA